MKKDNYFKNTILFVQIVLTMFGSILAVVLFFRTLKTPSLLGILDSLTYLITYMSIIFYNIMYYKKKGNIYFQGVIYAYAALIGIQILQAGNYMSDFGLTQNVAVLINCCNLISFSNIIKFSDNLNSKKIALLYMVIAVVLKLIIEICLIVRMITYVQIIHILMSLSIAILGITIIVAYINRLQRINESKD